MSSVWPPLEFSTEADLAAMIQEFDLPLNIQHQRIPFFEMQPPPINPELEATEQFLAGSLHNQRGHPLIDVVDTLRNDEPERDHEPTDPAGMRAVCMDKTPTSCVATATD